MVVVVVVGHQSLSQLCGVCIAGRWKGPFCITP
jgi:hypothetical protein